MNRNHLAALLIQIPFMIYLAGCLPDGSQPIIASETAPESSTGAVTLKAGNSFAAGRSSAAEPGGELHAEIRHPSRRVGFKDSVRWSGSGDISLSFPGVPEGAGYTAIVTYRDPRGLTTHSDTLGDIAVVRSRDTEALFRLKPLLGRLQLVVPTAPATVDTLSLSWQSSGTLRSTRAVRGPSGRTALRIDSLAIGATGSVRIRAWNAAGDTLYFADTTATILSQADQSLQVRLKDARGALGAGIEFLSGGEIDAVALFPDDRSPAGRLVIGALSDSGGSDWIRIENRGTDSFAGPVQIVRGTESFTVDLRLASGASAVATRAVCAALSSTHPLSGTPNLVCGQTGLSVSWSTSGTLWELRSNSGTLQDQVVVYDGQQGWPDLNSSTARTLRRAPRASTTEAAAGRSWCADASDSPTSTTCD